MESKKNEDKSARGPRGRPGARGQRGERGQMGKTGARGRRGERGEPGTSAPLDLIARMARELESAQRELQVQFSRIAQLQSDLDILRAELKASN